MVRPAHIAAHVLALSALVTLVLGGCLLAHPVFAAGTADGWGTDLDCASCHTKEAAAFEETPSEQADAPADTKREATEKGAAAGTKTDGSAANASKNDGAASEKAETDAENGTDSFLAIHGAFGCASCHSDAKLPDLHENATADSKMPKKLKKTDVSEELCLGCHGSSEELAGLTEGCTLLTDDNGTVVNPHALPDVPDHDPIECTDCHAVHNGKTVEETAPAKCLSCHHENVYECGTCH